MPSVSRKDQRLYLQMKANLSRARARPAVNVTSDENVAPPTTTETEESQAPTNSSSEADQIVVVTW